MITYNLMNSGSDSLYAYLCKSIKRDILHGTLKPGWKFYVKAVQL